MLLTVSNVDMCPLQTASIRRCLCCCWKWRKLNLAASGGIPGILTCFFVSSAEGILGTTPRVVVSKLLIPSYFLLSSHCCSETFGAEDGRLSNVHGVWGATPGVWRGMVPGVDSLCAGRDWDGVGGLELLVLSTGEVGVLWIPAHETGRFRSDGSGCGPSSCSSSTVPKIAQSLH